ncbi:hypothetical protein FD755_012877 [Muntiacus reevesi]|uniref:Uncharacterized protein n=1 Tax=Muntiacus reevesi TaxID=9886 RepID=A0A5N3XQ57_MUNRE|nr:hypothetical protein FD755_012877 [Muntiacus reevesi]
MLQSRLGQPATSFSWDPVPPLLSGYHRHTHMMTYMHLFGHYPAHDDFYLVVCSACNQVVKPQVFQSHCGVVRGSPLAKMFGAVGTADRKCPIV